MIRATDRPNGEASGRPVSGALGEFLQPLAAVQLHLAVGKQGNNAALLELGEGPADSFGREAQIACPYRKLHSDV